MRVSNSLSELHGKGKNTANTAREGNEYIREKGERSGADGTRADDHKFCLCDTFQYVYTAHIMISQRRLGNIESKNDNNTNYLYKFIVFIVQMHIMCGIIMSHTLYQCAWLSWYGTRAFWQAHRAESFTLCIRNTACRRTRKIATRRASVGVRSGSELRENTEGGGGRTASRLIATIEAEI